MNLQKLFQMQKVLDDHIMDEHPELKGQNNLDWKILALLVEIGECANEWRGFKKWSTDQKPRTEIAEPDIEHFDKTKEARWIKKNPLLEEYVDCLHFILSIGLEIERIYENELSPIIQNNRQKIEDVINQFNTLFLNATSLYISTVDEYYDFEDMAGIFSELFESFIELGEMLGFTWDQVEQAYFEKNKINHQRQEDGY